MKAITTKYYGATDHIGSRIVAVDSDGNRVSISYEDTSSNPHRDAAVALCKKMGWTRSDHLVEGFTKEGRVYVFLPENCCPCCSQRMDLIQDLASLLEWAKGNRGRKEGNPYAVPEVRQALTGLCNVTGSDPKNYLDVDTKKLAGENDSRK